MKNVLNFVLTSCLSFGSCGTIVGPRTTEKSPLGIETELGRTFASLIHDFLSTSSLLNKCFLPIYNTNEGRKVYEETLSVVNERFPQYVREIQGIADGSRVEFHKLMLLHFDDIIPNVVNQNNVEYEPSGCSSIYIDNGNENILAHTEDAAMECLDNFYIVSAHVISDTPQGVYEVKEEIFSSLCYPGHIGGYTMSYNQHGMVFTINTLVAKKLLSKKTPRHFITRALLAAKNYEEAINILNDCGAGAANGCSINMAFLNQNEDTKFFNIEMGPSYSTNESFLDILPFNKNSHMIHCNHYLRLNMPECDGIVASKERIKTLQNFSIPKSLDDIKNMLGDTSHKDHWIFRCKENSETKTICVGIFDLKLKTWSLYKDNPKCSEPVAVLHLDIK